MRKCPFCKSLFVCWNWVYVPKEKLIKLNPYLKIFGVEWGHKCWQCGAVNITHSKVKDGMPYWLLKFLDKYFGRYK